MPSDLPLYANVDFDLANPQVGLGAILSDITNLIIFPYPKTGQSLFFPFPPLVTGPLLQLSTNQTRFNGGNGVSSQQQLALMQYKFNAQFINKLIIHSDLGLTLPTPCFEVPQGGNTFKLPVISKDDWGFIINEIETSVTTFANLHQMTLQQAKLTIPLSSLPMTFTTLVNKFASLSGVQMPNILGWMYHNHDNGQSSPSSSTLHFTTTPTTTIYQNQVLLPPATSCIFYTPITKFYPTITNDVRHDGTVYSTRIITANNDLLEPTIIPYTSPYHTNTLSFPRYVNTAGIINDDDDQDTGVKNNRPTIGKDTSGVTSAAPFHFILVIFITILTLFSHQ